MSELMSDAINLMMVGMGFVFVFLVILVVVTMIMSKHHQNRFLHHSEFELLFLHLPCVQRSRIHTPCIQLFCPLLLLYRIFSAFSIAVKL